MALALPFGAAIGLALGMLGGGGSMLAVPVLVYVLGQSVQDATTTSLVVVSAGALAGGLGHARGGRVCWRHAASFVAGALPGVIAGTAAGDAIGASGLIAAFAVIMLVAAAATWRKAGGLSPAETHTRPGCPPLRLARDLSAGLGIGVMTGFFGVGGGFLVVPTLVGVLALSMRLAVGTSLMIITATSMLGLAAHLAAGRHLDVPVTGAMAAACVTGALLGAAVAARVPQRLLGRGFAGLLALVAVSLIASVALGGG